mmetsp:Transcript_16295/g.28496  ORF Transcript_16295/g.28496 Transcript_16295/m.28496 type:complete len:502 (-) Transcript_16295:130-1635(-)
MQQGANKPLTPTSGIVAEEMSKEISSAVFETVLTAKPGTGASAESQGLLKLQAELQAAKEDLELATLKEEELQSRVKKSQEAQEVLSGQLLAVQQDLQEHRGRASEEQTLLRRDLEIAQTELQNLKGQDNSLPGDASSLHAENSSLKAKVSVLESELSGLHMDLSQRQASTAVPEGEPSFANASSEESPLLGAAYQQISVLNTQLAHLYAELTVSRTEAASLRAQQEGGGGGGGHSAHAAASAEATAAIQAESQKQAQQIADLVSDIRHLQLDLEYHQQKVDQLLEEKQQMMKDLKSTQTELSEAKKELEEKDQILKHQEVDLLHYRQQEQQSPRGGGPGGAGDDGMLDALRTEAAAKDSALIVSHYELHKEKLMRDRLEQKNLKLMERMQKLMMVVETMRKDNVALERTLAAKDRAHDEKDAQLRIVTQKVRQMQKHSKVGRSKGVSKAPAPLLELEGSMQNLPPLDSARRSESANGRRSTTPRGAGPAPPSPYHSARGM